jgi:hypothetical protein
LRIQAAGFLGAFFAAAPQKTGIYDPLPQPAAGPCGGLPVFPLLSLALPKNDIHVIFGLGVLLRENPRESLAPASMPAIHADFRLSEFTLHAKSNNGSSQPPACVSVPSNTYVYFPSFVLWGVCNRVLCASLHWHKIAICVF